MALTDDLRRALVGGGTPAALAIRKPAPAGRLGADELVASEAWTADVRDFLASAMRAGLNCLLYGPTGSGKTTNLRALLGPREVGARVVVLEHTAELRLDLPNVAALEAVPRPSGDLTLADIFPVTLQLLPEVIVLGGILSGEALPFLNAALSGHQVLATVHAGSPELALAPGGPGLRGRARPRPGARAAGAGTGPSDRDTAAAWCAWRSRSPAELRSGLQAQYSVSCR